MKTTAFIIIRGQVFLWKIGHERSFEAFFIAKKRDVLQGIFTKTLEGMKKLKQTTMVSRINIVKFKRK